jgi:hypothetical protein
MPKDATKNIDRYKIRGGQLNEFDFQQNQEEFVESQKPTAPNLIPGTPPEAKEPERERAAKAVKAVRATKSVKSTKRGKATKARTTKARKAVKATKAAKSARATKSVKASKARKALPRGATAKKLAARKAAKKK